MSFKIAIVGRPNVGKSTLFNRLTGSGGTGTRGALVHDLPGMTRDWREGRAEIGHRQIRVFDTAGLEEAAEGTLEARMQRQIEDAVAAADLVLFVIDARTGVTPVDEHFADWLRRTGAAVRVVANKCEGRAGESGALEAYSLGFDEPIAISAEHGEGTGDLVSEIAERMDAAALEDTEDASARPLHLAIIGRPNAGKSTLLNTLIGRERVLTGPEAGITRDAIAVDWQWRDQPIRLFDTAGLRRKSRVSGPLEKLSVEDALEAIRFAEVVILLIDAEHAWEKQDRHLADLVAEEGRAMVIALNKSDLVPEPSEMRRALEKTVDEALPQARGVPVIGVSALTGQGVDDLMTAVMESYDRWNRRIATGQLNRFLEDTVAANPPPAPGGRRIKLRYMTQPKTRPPRFVVFASQPEELPESYRRYLVNEIRAAFDLTGVPIRLYFRKGENPYV